MGDFVLMAGPDGGAWADAAAAAKAALDIDVLSDERLIAALRQVLSIA